MAEDGGEVRKGPEWTVIPLHSSIPWSVPWRLASASSWYFLTPKLEIKYFKELDIKKAVSKPTKISSQRFTYLSI